MRRIFQNYANWRSLQAIAHALNSESIPFRGKATRRGPQRRGWAVSTVRVILRNEKYAGTWVWNKRRFLKDPETGRRRPVPRPPHEWVRQEHPELRIINADLWDSVQERLRYMEQAHGVSLRSPARGAAHVAYSPYLLSGVLRCGVCGARMIAQTATRKKGTDVYRYGWYRCGFARAKGPAVCTHGTGYRRERLEGALLAKFREAMTPERIRVLARSVNSQIEMVFKGHNGRTAHVTEEVRRLENQVGNLVRFLANGGDSVAVRSELAELEGLLERLRAELATLEKAAKLPMPQVHPAWVWAKLNRLDELIREHPVRARIELVKHLDGDLLITPRPSLARERRAEIAGRVKSDSLLSAQEAVCLQVVAGAGFEPATFGLCPLQIETGANAPQTTPRKLALVT